eukprot:TRINITY_DN67572_c4_g1_i1.p1 TRINITY_DN67572_c4_g1~~TRINITY_DN67572_c4_g1_i1.p1  ORF type:complete len:428 (+),score=28.07 TRINITY_DN67572_c4_g1_i1:42-1325(+)
MPVLNLNSAIRIIGGGPGGLCAATALSQQGFTNVKLFERDPSKCSAAQAYAVSLHQKTGLAALEAIGVNTDPLGRPGSSQFKILRSTGSHLLSLFPKQGDAEFHTQVNRQLLRDTLLDHLPDPNMLSWNKQCTSFTQTEDGPVRLTFQDGATEEADVVIAADGNKSLFRNTNIGVRRIYRELISVHGTIPAPKDKDLAPYIQEGSTIIVDGENTLFLNRVSNDPNDRSLRWTVTWPWPLEQLINIQETAERSRDLWRHYLVPRTVWLDWLDPVHELINSNDPAGLSFTAHYDVNMPPKWKPTQVTFLGDSGHPMVPFGGTGANHALNDAIQLAKLFKEGADNGAQVVDIVLQHDRATYERVLPAVVRSRQMAGFFHSNDVLDDLKFFKFFDLPVNKAHQFGWESDRHEEGEAMPTATPHWWQMGPSM